MAGRVPMGPGGDFNSPFEILGRSKSNSPAFIAFVNAATPDFFKTLRVQLIKGRFLNEHDKENTPWAVVINEAMARKFWQDRDPLGQIIREMGKLSPHSFNDLHLLGQDLRWRFQKASTTA